MTNDQLAAVLAEHVMGWGVGPDRFLMGQRRWISRWRFQPTERLQDALRLLDEAAPEQFTMGLDKQGDFWVRVRIHGVMGEACETSKARAIAFAVARALGIDVEANA